MINMHLVDRAGFTVAGKQVWIGGQDNTLFGRFWEQCKADGTLDALFRLRQQSGLTAGPQTNGAVLGVSRVEADPARRDFFYMIAVEVPAVLALPEDLEIYHVPAGSWAVFDCYGPMPDALVASEIYAFSEWLPSSGYRHAHAPEMEVYPPTDEAYVAFWLPVEKEEQPA